MKEGWKYEKLGNLGSFLRGSGILKSDFVETGVPCIHYGQIHTKFGVSTATHLTEISQELFNKSKIANPGDVIIAITSEDVEGSCKSIAWEGNYDVAVGAHAAIFKHNQNAKYLSYCFRSGGFGIQKAKYAHGFKVVEIKPSEIAEISIPVPPLSEQQQIVEELDLLSGIIEKKKEQLKELDNLAQSIFYEMFGDPVANEKGWEKKKWNTLFKLKSGDGLSAKQFVPGYYPVYGGNGISGFHNAYNLEGDFIIVGRVGAYCGNVRAVNGKFWLTDNAFQLFYDKEKYNKVFLSALLNILDLHQYANAAAQPVISNSSLKEIDVMLPPIHQQVLFASKIEAIEKQKALIKQSITETETLFNSRMDYYFG